MGLFDFFKKKPAAQEQPKRAVAGDEDSAPGWDAITDAFEKLYPGQTNPLHRAPRVMRMYDISENAAPYDGMSAYDAGDHWHLVSYGLTELYGKEQDDASRSGFGFELTIRVPKTGDRPPMTAFNVLDGIGRAVWKGTQLGIGHTIKTGPVDGDPATPETAMLVVRDPSFADPIDTPHGKVDFLTLVGVRDEVRQQMWAAHDASNGKPGWEKDIVDALRTSNPKLITPIYKDPA